MEGHYESATVLLQKNNISPQQQLSEDFWFWEFPILIHVSVVDTEAHSHHCSHIVVTPTKKRCERQVHNH